MPGEIGGSDEFSIGFAYATPRSGFAAPSVRWTIQTDASSAGGTRPFAVAHHSSARRLASSRVLASNVLSMHQLSDCSKIKPLPPYYVPKSGYANDARHKW